MQLWFGSSSLGISNLRSVTQKGGGPRLGNVMHQSARHKHLDRLQDKSSLGGRAKGPGEPSAVTSDRGRMFPAVSPGRAKRARGELWEQTTTRSAGDRDFPPPKRSGLSTRSRGPDPASDSLQAKSQSPSGWTLTTREWDGYRHRERKGPGQTSSRPSAACRREQNSCWNLSQGAGMALGGFTKAPVSCSQQPTDTQAPARSWRARGFEQSLKRNGFD